MLGTKGTLSVFTIGQYITSASTFDINVLVVHKKLIKTVYKVNLLPEDDNLIITISVEY